MNNNSFVCWVESQRTAARVSQIPGNLLPCTHSHTSSYQTVRVVSFHNTCYQLEKLIRHMSVFCLGNLKLTSISTVYETAWVAAVIIGSRSVVRYWCSVVGQHIWLWRIAIALIVDRHRALILGRDCMRDESDEHEDETGLHLGRHQSLNILFKQHFKVFRRAGWAIEHVF